MSGWLRWFVIGFVSLWLIVLGLVLLRTLFFLLTLVWMGAREWYEQARGSAGRSGES